MVAFYIQNTKKILSYVILFILLTLFKCSYQPNSVSNCKEISNYIDLELRFATDTVQMDKIARLYVIFKNKTDTTLQFYPKSVIHLTKPFVAFGLDIAYLINDTLDVTRSTEIKPRSTYLDSYNIFVNEKFFKVGENFLSLKYRYSEILNEKDKIYNELCGSLTSSEVKLIIIPK